MYHSVELFRCQIQTATISTVSYTPSLMTFNNDQVKNALYIQIHILKQAHYQWFGTQIISLQFKTIKYHVTYHKFCSATTFYQPAFVQLHSCKVLFLSTKSCMLALRKSSKLCLFHYNLYSGMFWGFFVGFFFPTPDACNVMQP